MAWKECEERNFSLLYWVLGKWRFKKYIFIYISDSKRRKVIWLRSLLIYNSAILFSLTDSQFSPWVILSQRWAVSQDELKHKPLLTIVQSNGKSKGKWQKQGTDSHFVGLKLWMWISFFSPCVFFKWFLESIARANRLLCHFPAFSVMICYSQFSLWNCEAKSILCDRLRLILTLYFSVPLRGSSSYHSLAMIFSNRSESPAVTLCDILHVNNLLMRNKYLVTIHKW